MLGSLQRSWGLLPSTRPTGKTPTRLLWKTGW